MANLKVMEKCREFFLISKPYVHPPSSITYLLLHNRVLHVSCPPKGHYQATNVIYKSISMYAAKFSLYLQARKFTFRYLIPL